MDTLWCPNPSHLKDWWLFRLLFVCPDFICNLFHRGRGWYRHCKCCVGTWDIRIWLVAISRCELVFRRSRSLFGNKNRNPVSDKRPGSIGWSHATDVFIFCITLGFMNSFHQTQPWYHRLATPVCNQLEGMSQESALNWSMFQEQSLSIAYAKCVYSQWFYIYLVHCQGSHSIYHMASGCRYRLGLF